jgi:hypothetical protein
MKLPAPAAAFCAALILAAAILPAAAPWDTLQQADGAPFFFPADTAGHLRSLSEADIDAYPRDWAAKQFNVVHKPVHKPCCSKNKGPYIQ